MLGDFMLLRIGVFHAQDQAGYKSIIEQTPRAATYINCDDDQEFTWTDMNLMIQKLLVATYFGFNIYNCCKDN